MRFAIAAALALTAASSLHAQVAQMPTAVDPGYATPVQGSWLYSAVAGGSNASFLDTAGRPQLTIHCTRAARRVRIAKPATGAAPFLLMWTTSMSRNVPASFDPATALLSADLSAYDPLLDALAFSRARIAVTVSGGAQLVVPNWPEVERVIEDCRA